VSLSRLFSASIMNRIFGTHRMVKPQHKTSTELVAGEAKQYRA
jgi:hypothetical protein